MEQPIEREQTDTSRSDTSRLLEKDGDKNKILLI